MIKRNTIQVALRSFTKADVPVWFGWFNDPEVTRYMNKGAFPNTPELQEEHYNKIIKSRNDVAFAVLDETQGKLVGTVGVHKIDWLHRHGEISVVVGDRQYWGKGIATQAIKLAAQHAFAKLNLHRLASGVWAPNVGCIKAFEANGFVREGLGKEAFFCEEHFVDVVLLGLLRNDWEKGRSI